MSAKRDVWPEDLVDILDGALLRTRRRLRESAPNLAVSAASWMTSLAHGAPVARYFTHPRAFPLLLLPWWLEATIRVSPSRAFQRGVVYSTVNGYYAVRLIDDLMDGDRPPPREVIPALQFFHTEFERTYSRYFPFGHAFWEAFIDGWLSGADSASRDASFETIDEDRFVQVSAKKTMGARVPLAAVCHRYGRTELLEPWYGFVELFGAWHQMLNDMVGWKRDLDAGRTTYFLSQARAGTHSTGSIAEWVVADGLSWGRGQLDACMDKVAIAARGLQCPPLVAYLHERQSAIERDWQRLIPDLAALSRLASVMRATER